MLAIFTGKNSRGYHALLLMRLHRPVGTVLLLCPTLMALWLASKGHPSWELVGLFTLGVIVMRSAGCVINDWADRHVDGHVKRTQQRPLITQKLRSQEALGLFAGLLCIAFFIVLTMNRMTIALSFVAVLLAMIYPFMKCYTHFPQVVLGAAFGWAIPMAFAAQIESLPKECWWLYGATLLWTIAYDTIYAMADKEEDILIQVKSTAILFGKYDKLIIAMLQIATVAIWWIIGNQLKLNGYFTLSLILAISFMIYQQWLIKDSLPERCIRAFLNNQWVGAVLFVGVVLGF